MNRDILLAATAGLLGTTVMTAMMLAGKQVGLPAIDVHGLLGYIRRSDRRTRVGDVMHWLLGAVFAIPYFVVFRLFPYNPLLLGAAAGIVHWLVVGGMFAFAPRVHAGMQAGTVKEAGAYMTKSLGIMGFIGGMTGHVVFGLVVALVYTWVG